MSTAPQAPSASPQGTLGRTAWLVLLAGLFGMGAIICVVVLCEGYAARQRMDIRPAYHVALALGAVTLIWAPLLAVRALLRGENQRLPIRLINVATILPALYAGAYWFRLPQHILLDRPWIQEFFLPVLLPFVALATLSGTLLIPRLLRAIERRRALKARPSWTPRTRLRWLAVLSIFWAAILAVVLLPFPLFLYAVLFPRNEERAHYTNEGISRPQNFIMAHTPNFIRDAAESFLTSFSNKRVREAPLLQLRMGYVSLERLIVRASDPNRKVSYEALSRLKEIDPRRAADIAFGLIQNPNATSPYFELHGLVGQHGTPEQRKAMLEQAARNSTTTLHPAFFYGLGQGPADQALLPLLEAHFHSKAVGHEYAMMPLLLWLPDARAEKLLQDAVESNDPAARNMAFETNWSWAQHRAQLAFKIFFYGFEHKDIAVRKNALDRATLYNLPRELKLDCVRRLLKILDGDDLVQRRAAAEFIERRMGIPELYSPQSGYVIYAYTPADPSKPVETGGAPAPLTDPERAALDAVTKAAKEWLAKQEPPK